MKMGKKMLAGAGLVLTAGFAFATDMAETAPTVASVETAFAGRALVTCADPKGWTFDVKASVDDGRDVVTVEIRNEKEADPPRFGVLLRVPGAGVQNVWTSSCQDAYHLWPQLWWGGHQLTTHLASQTPISVGFNSQEKAPVAIACSEAMECLKMALYADDRTCEVVGRVEFFREKTSTRRSYRAKILFDRRGRGLADTVRACADWVIAQNGFVPAGVPDIAREPLYSTWYAYLQDVHAEELEREAKLAAGLGMKVMILDDGWQKVDSKEFYSATGDWMPVKSRFPDMKAHVAKVHAAGLKYMLWLSVAHMGDESKAYARFKDKMLSSGHTGVLDPRFPEVREYLISTYERVVGEWDFDGLKLDFIDAFHLRGTDPALKDDFAGRDYKSVPQAVDRLMRDVLARVKKIKPDVLIEFRQRYMGPAIRQYGNMIRVADCPADPCANRRRMCDLRLTSGDTAVHSDMLVWSKDETPEGAALPILNVLFATIQYSMILKDIPESHREVIRHWIRFSSEHRAALLQGSFTPHHAENGYPWIESEDARERVVAAYSSDVCVRTGAPDKTVYLVNATGAAGVLAEFAAPCPRVELFDVVGRKTGEVSVAAGLTRLPVPSSGYARIRSAAK